MVIARYWNVKPLLLGIIALSSCTLETAPENGKQLCAESASNPCASGFYCAVDSHCWRMGTGPSDADASATQTPDAMTIEQQKDAEPPVDAFEPHKALPAPSGRAVVPGGSRMKSSSFRAVITAGQSPGGNRVMKSANYRFVGGLVGSTGNAQGKK
jgi:hypothetical protein